MIRPRFALIGLLFIALPAVGHADSEQNLPTTDAHSETPFNAVSCSPDGIALDGFDVVAYHVLDDAVLGTESITAEHGGLSYYFSREEHRELFIAQPESYLPQFQGWCAIALARNRLTCPDYQNFKIEDGKLLLFETIAFVNGRSVWDSDPEQNRAIAERNFSRLLAQ